MILDENNFTLLRYNSNTRLGILIETHILHSENLSLNQADRIFKNNLGIKVKKNMIKIVPEEKYYRIVIQLEGGTDLFCEGLNDRTVSRVEALLLK